MASTFWLAQRVALFHPGRMARAQPVRWTRNQLLIAMNLYCKLPFGKLDARTPVIVQTARKMGRTANSLAMKLSNFASLDPLHRARGIKGLEGASDLDREVWKEFHEHSDALGMVGEELFQELFTKDDKHDAELTPTGVKVRPAKIPVAPTGPTERRALVTQRRGQQFFRQTILNIYHERCCITGIAVPELLVASHILPWSQFPEERLNPQNGLCLSSLHDAAFDCGLITFDADLRLVLSKELRNYFPYLALEQNFDAYGGKRIAETEKLSEPKREFLEHHRSGIFKG
jgi:putative restriction endonuclease